MGEVTLLRQIRLLSAFDDTASFSSGVASLDEWLRLRALSSVKGGTASVYVAIDEDDLICGYYALSAYSVELAREVAGRLRRNAPNPIPCTLLGRLAVDESCRGCGIGKALLRDAIARSVAASAIVASRALVVEPLDEQVAAFYARYGFKPLDGDGQRLYLLLRV